MTMSWSLVEGTSQTQPAETKKRGVEVDCSHAGDTRVTKNIYTYIY